MPVLSLTFLKKRIGIFLFENFYSWKRLCSTLNYATYGNDFSSNDSNEYDHIIYAK
jgi:hypothetical protein